MIKQLIFIAISILIGYSTASSQPKYIQTEKKGNGYPMILIHGMACSADVWNEFTNRYVDDYELHIVTLPGFGNKEPFEAEHILETIPQLQFAMAETAFHFVFYDEPEWFYQVVDDFLAEK